LRNSNGSSSSPGSERKRRSVARRLTLVASACFSGLSPGWTGEKLRLHSISSRRVGPYLGPAALPQRDDRLSGAQRHDDDRCHL
jgi:hypothetical protein